MTPWMIRVKEKAYMCEANWYSMKTEKQAKINTFSAVAGGGKKSQKKGFVLKITSVYLWVSEDLLLNWKQTKMTFSVQLFE